MKKLTFITLIALNLILQSSIHLTGSADKQPQVTNSEGSAMSAYIADDINISKWNILPDSTAEFSEHVSGNNGFILFDDLLCKRENGTLNSYGVSLEDPLELEWSVAPDILTTSNYIRYQNKIIGSTIRGNIVVYEDMSDYAAQIFITTYHPSQLEYNVQAIREFRGCAWVLFTELGNSNPSSSILQVYDLQNSSYPLKFQYEFPHFASDMIFHSDGAQSSLISVGSNSLETMDQFTNFSIYAINEDFSNISYSEYRYLPGKTTGFDRAGDFICMNQQIDGNYFIAEAHISKFKGGSAGSQLFNISVFVSSEYSAGKFISYLRPGTILTSVYPYYIEGSVLKQIPDQPTIPDLDFVHFDESFAIMCYADQNATTIDYGIDEDNDQLTNLFEIYEYQTSPIMPDTDCDFLSDYEEVNLLPSPTDPLNPDTDGDLIFDGIEVQRGTNPKYKYDSDSDLDGLLDYEEARLQTDPFNPDTDGDGLSDFYESEKGTSPLDADTDSDGYSDLEEVSQGSDPKDPANTPDTTIFSKFTIYEYSLIGSVVVVLIIGRIIYSKKKRSH